VADDRRRTRRGSVDTALRTSAIWTVVSDLADRRQRELGRPLRVLDLGGGTGGLAVPLAEAGHAVTVVDPSPDALASLRRRAAESHVEGRVTATQGDADSLADLVGDRPVDLVCCHGTLEVVDDPAAALERICGSLVHGGYLSLVAAQRLSVVLAKAMAGHFTQAAHALSSEDGRWGDTDPLPRRFDAATLTDMVVRAGFTVSESHGVRIFSDLVPSALLDSEGHRAALLDLERAAASHPKFPFLGQLGAALHLVARRT
jgi:SAM-dependent methyltransferase